MKEKTLFGKIFYIIGLIFKAIFTFFDAFKFMFSIPVLSLASVVFAIFLALVFRPLLSFFPSFFSTGIFETASAGIVFIFLKYLIFNDQLQHKLDFEHNQYLYTFMPTVLLWIIPIFLLGPTVANTALDFFEAGETESFWTILYLVLYTPHMWLAILTQEFYYSVMAGLAINCLIFFILARIAIWIFIGDLSSESKTPQEPTNRYLE